MSQLGAKMFVLQNFEQKHVISLKTSLLHNIYLEMILLENKITDSFDRECIGWWVKPPRSERCKYCLTFKIDAVLII